MDWRRWFGRRRKPTVVEGVAITPGVADVQAVGEAVFVSVASSVQAPSRWLSRHLPERLRWVAGLDWLVLIMLGLSMTQVDEYLIAVFFWFLSILVLVAKAITWGGIKNSPKLTRLARLVLIIAAILSFGFMMVWTYFKKADKAWSNLTAAKSTTEVVSIACNRSLLPNVSDAAGVRVLSLRGDGGFSVHWGELPWGKTPPFGRRCHLKSYGQRPVFDVAMTLRATFKEVVVKPAARGARLIEPGPVKFSRDWAIEAAKIDPGEPGFVFYAYNDGPFFVSVDLPLIATLRLGSDTKRQTIGVMQASEATEASVFFAPDFVRFGPLIFGTAPPRTK